MAVGPGKYDDLCTYVREQAEAELAIVVIGGGNRGEGFCVQSANADVTAALPKMLRCMADSIEKDINSHKN